MKLLGAVLSVLWCVVVAAGAWLEVNEGPSHFGWLMQFIAQKHSDPGGVRGDGYGLFFQAVDPARFLLAMLVPVAGAWLLAAAASWIFRGGRH